MKKILLIIFFIPLFCNSIFAQTYPLTSIDPWTTVERRQGSYNKMVGWDSSPYEELTYWKRTGPNYWNVTEYMNMRLLYPLGYDSLDATKEYPMIVMLHGAGESGVAWTGNYNYPASDPRYDNNDHQLLHGGQQHLNARNRPESHPRSFPGFILFPQVQYNGAWESGFTGGISNNNRKVVEIIEYLISHLNIDPNRIYVHGLSNGAKGSWDIINRRPDLFAAAAPMSGVGNANIMGSRLAHMPIWLFQGGTDTNPAPAAADQIISSLESNGGTPRYTLYPNLGHGVWNTAYEEPDFFSWFLSKSKLTIHAHYGITEFCPGETINVKLEISPGFSEYQWRKDNNILGNSNSNSIIASDFGAYQVRFKRGTEWTDWSEPLNITPKPISAQPLVSVSGSTALPALDGSTSVTLSAPEGHSTYLWSNGASTQSITVSNPGSYSVSVAESGGCVSPISAAVVVSVGNSPNSPIAPAQLAVNATSETTIKLSWNDISTNEKGFEIYRSKSSEGPFTFIQLTDANKSEYIDGNLEVNTTYYYQIRAINNNGGSGYSDVKHASTLQDIAAPTTPGSLAVNTTSESSIGVSWNASSDNVGVSGYEIKLNGIAVDTTAHLHYIFTSLSPYTQYLLEVRALDVSGNASSAAGLNATITTTNGINYSYYEGSWDLLPDFNSLTEVKSGIVNNFTLAPRDRDDNFAFSFEGMVEITTAGLYTFFTNSDDGSKLYINGLQVVDNDGLHGNVEKSGQISLSIGKHPIKVTYFEKSGGETLGVKYQGPGITKRNIPDNKLFIFTTEAEAPAPPDAPLAVSNLQVVNIGSDKVSLAWTDNANNEVGFRVYRSGSNADFNLIGTPSVNSSAFTDSSVNANTVYRYTVVVYNDGGSTKSDTLSIKTLQALPSSPTNLLAEAVSQSRIDLTWVAGSNNEEGFEVSRASVSEGNFQVIDSVGAGILAYSDVALLEGTSYSYLVRAYNEAGRSPYSDTISATTYPGLPQAPSELTNVTNSESGIVLAWIDNADNEEGFEIFRSEENGNFFELYDSVAINSVSYVDASATPGIVYFYKVRATNRSGKSDFSNVVSDSVIEVPVVLPHNLTVFSVSSSSVNLQWNDGENAYEVIEIQRKSSGGEYITLAEISKGIESYIDAGLNGNSTLEYRLKFGDLFTEPVTATTLNNSPVLHNIEDITVQEGKTHILEITAEDFDIPDNLSFVSNNLPAFASFVDNQDGSATLTIAPTQGQAGTYNNISISVADSHGGIDEQIITIVIEEEIGGDVSSVLYRVNSGYSSLADSPIPWSTDIQGNRSPYYNTSSVNSTAGWNYFGFTNTTHAPDVLFGSHRIGYSWGNAMQYNFPADGLVEVTLFFAERGTEVSTTGQRVFNIHIEGLNVLSNFDIYAEAGRDAISKTFYVNVSDGTLDIILNRVVGNPILCGIEIRGSQNGTDLLSALNTFGDHHNAITENASLEQPKTYSESVVIYPNPFVDELNISLPYDLSEVEQIFIVDRVGKVIYQEKNLSGVNTISLGTSQLNLAPGIYFLSIKSRNSAKHTIKIVKR